MDDENKLPFDEQKENTLHANENAFAGAQEAMPLSSPYIDHKLKDNSEPDGHYTVKLEAFEGPLDLLLHLIKREEINIYDIPIAKITAQYLDYIQLMQNLNINLAGEFLLVAATLIYIKSKMLLPPDPTNPDADLMLEEDPRQELVYQLLEHQKFKDAAQMLYARESLEAATWTNPPREFLENGEEVFAVTILDLVEAFKDILKRFSKRIILEYERDEVTIEEMITEIRNLLLVQTVIKFSSFYERSLSKQHLLMTFLAILELVRLREIKLRQKQLFGEIIILRAQFKQ